MDEQRRWMTVDQAAAYVSVARRTFDQLVKDGKMPQPVRLSNKILRWDREAIDRAMQPTQEE